MTSRLFLLDLANFAVLSMDANSTTLRDVRLQIDFLRLFRGNVFSLFVLIKARIHGIEVVHKDMHSR